MAEQHGEAAPRPHTHAQHPHVEQHGKGGKGLQHQHKKIPVIHANPNDFSQQVDFDGSHRTAQHGHADMTSDDLETALHFYGSLDKAFLQDVLIKHFEDRELENLFCDMQDVEDEETDALNMFVSHGKLNFDQYNQRWTSVPVACKKELPQETFKTDRYPYKLPKTVQDTFKESTSSPSQLTVPSAQDERLVPDESKKGLLKPEVPSATSNLPRLEQRASTTYIRIGDISQCPAHLLEPQISGSPLHDTFVSMQTDVVEPERRDESTMSFHVDLEGSSNPRKSFQVNSSLLTYPGAKNRFDSQPDQLPKAGTAQAGGTEVDQVPAGTYPDHSDLSVIYDYVQQYGQLIWADNTCLYAADHGRDILRKIGPHGVSVVVRFNTSHPALEAFRTGQAIRHNHIDHDLRYAMTTGFDEDVNNRHLMAIPLANLDGLTRGVVVFSRTWNFTAPFPDELFCSALEDVSSFAKMVWRGADCRRELNTYRVLGNRFQELYIEPKNWDNVIYKFMLLIKSQINPERVHLFRLNHPEDRAVASVYDTGRFSKQGYHFDYSKEVSLPIQQTFLRNILKIGDVINVKGPADAWLAGTGLDDLLPGPEIRNFLAMAFNEDWEGRVCEVIVLINAVGTHGFLQCEEAILRTVLTFFYSAMGTHYFRYRLAATAQPLRVENELFYRLSNESREDVQELERLCDETYPLPEEFMTFDFYCISLMDDDFTLPKLLVYMMDTLFGVNGFCRNKLVSFVIAVREGYRNIRYHSWQHGFHVAHCMFRILHTNPDILTTLERKALMIGAVCHDLDHLGYTNVFIKKHSSPFEHLYPASQMEHHHIRETFRLLANPENDIIADFSAAEKSDFCLLLKQAILATDIVKYFAGKEILEAILDEGLNLEKPTHRRRFMDLIMSSSDLSLACKPWHTQVDSTADLYEEFHSQGDLEKMYGELPIPMMDRDNADHLEREQIGFITVVCLPMYSMLERALPNTAALREGCQRNILAWTEEAVRVEARRVAEGRHPHPHHQQQQHGHTHGRDPHRDDHDHDHHQHHHHHHQGPGWDDSSPHHHERNDSSGHHQQQQHHHHDQQGAPAADNSNGFRASDGGGLEHHHHHHHRESE
ncbi:cAMP and cAMP-inhibited cGMP 3',5'-cyclic phosphodiesterase 10A [Hypsibius exemplaris]|uniref:Phosphodiesterase n=1 Tax=Hypsibius exemplaris TaxID=2072580 RepID=A0A1W0WML6_HYPEX|nr:cAMP and cAMP-inhibited cGMP 3',5'-cyclic phosphodiesterase 10A [Hypsibius exemplaris]